jgi:DNA-binding NarL/FixJ family response regulator
MRPSCAPGWRQAPSPTRRCSTARCPTPTDWTSSPTCATSQRVIMLTIADSDEEISEAISSGVDGYVIKSSDPDQVLAAIRSVCDGQSSFPLNIMQKMARGELSNSALSALTAREMEIVDHVKEGLSNKAIAYKMTLSENTVRNHLRNIMEKLGLRNRVQVATLALKEDRKRH